MPTLLRRWKNAQQGVLESEQVFQSISQTTSKEHQIQWSHMAKEASLHRLKNPAAMNIYDISKSKGLFSNMHIILYKINLIRISSRKGNSSVKASRTRKYF